MATLSAPRSFAGLSPTALVLAGSMLASSLWGAWATREIVMLGRREVVTVQLSRIMGDFVEAEARSGRPTEETQTRVAAYLKAVEASVQALGKEGRTVLVAEAVVSGGVPDLTEQVRADVARRLGAPGAGRHDAR
ncbi:TrbI F-type domain-containing protein [Sphingorhabdus sp.]|uniref:TrbI F-type domain-containing protein n=1 Tax=Sphingorhabdus sp. TaxID=1902408 RepID=UPI0032B786B4